MGMTTVRNSVVHWPRRLEENRSPTGFSSDYAFSPQNAAGSEASSHLASSNVFYQ
jgi:hypothetical protein